MKIQQLISIIVPFKNTVQYLGECLDSIISQSYTNWEVLAVDDGSADGSLELVIDYTQREHRIKVFKNKGVGIIPALQTAYENAMGNFITRMDSDDIMKPNRLEVMHTSLVKKSLGHLAIGKVKYFSQRGISNGYDRYEKWLNRLTETGTNFTEIYKECAVPSPCWMAHRNDFDRCGGFAHHRYPEDYDLTFRFYENGLKPIPCHEILHLWRDYDTRTSRTHEHYAQNYFLDIKTDYFLKLDYDPNRPLVVWGAGFKGKYIAKKLVLRQIKFIWLCDNPKKIHKKIYGQPLYHFSTMETMKDPQSIITVANEKAQLEIRSYLEAIGQQSMRDYYFFC